MCVCMCNNKSKYFQLSARNAREHFIVRAWWHIMIVLPGIIGIL